MTYNQKKWNANLPNISQKKKIHNSNTIIQ